MSGLRSVYKFLIAGGIIAAAVSALVPIAFQVMTTPSLSSETVKIRASRGDEMFDVFVRNASNEPLDLIEVRLVSESLPTFASEELYAQLVLPIADPDHLNAAPETTAVYTLNGAQTRIRLASSQEQFVLIIPVLQAIEGGDKDRFELHHDGISSDFHTLVFIDLHGNAYVATPDT